MKSSGRSRFTVYFSVAEPSADRYASLLIRKLKQQHPQWAIVGMGGEKCQAEGLELRVHPDGLALIGGVEVLGSLNRIRNRLRELTEDIQRVKPDILVPVDLPGFHSHLLPRVSSYVGKVLYFIPPMVYGRKKNRASKLKSLVDAVVVIFPYDISFYEQAGIPTYYFGHPLLEVLPFRQTVKPEWGLLLPGSRESEVRFFVPFFFDCLQEIMRRKQDQRFHIVFASSQQMEHYESYIRKQGMPVSFSAGNLYECLPRSICAVSVSGTVTLEVALYGVPEVIVYRASPLTLFLAKRFFLSIHQIGLPNLILGKPVVPERIGRQLQPQIVASDMLFLLQDSDAQAKQRQAFAAITKELKKDGLCFENMVLLMEQLSCHQSQCQREAKK